MKKEYDFSNAKKNPYLSGLKKQVTIRLDPETINYFKHLAEDNGIPYQTIINLYLRDCAQKHKKLSPPIYLSCFYPKYMKNNINTKSATYK